MTPRAKQLLLTILVAGFALQTALVYSDDRAEPLDAAAVRGRALWHRYACQVCHQIYGNGGFLGPDLTNAASRVDSIRLSSLLTNGSGQMPALHLSPAEIADVRAFLAALDRPERGRGQLRLGTRTESPWQRLGTLIAADDGADPSVRRGWEHFMARPCTACHELFAAMPGGAPDLARSVETRDPAALDSVLITGRPARGMPPPVPPLDAAARSDVIALFTWMAAHRDSLAAALTRRATEPVRWSAIPWWEYR